jgi:hypothetical protein
METVTVYAAGTNMPGYLPDNGPDCFPTWKQAKDSLVWEMNSRLDFLQEGIDAERREYEPDRDLFRQSDSLTHARDHLDEFLAEGVGGSVLVDDCPSGTVYFIEPIQVDPSEYLVDMREWIRDSFSHLDAFIVDDDTIVSFVAQRYDGGIVGFICDGDR